MAQSRMGRWVLALSFMLIGLNVYADIPFIMNYQGKVTDSAGVPVNGNGYFKFAIVNGTGDTAYWANDGATMNGTEPTAAITVPVTDGRFTVKLGDTNLTNMAALSPAVFATPAIYLRVWFSVDGTNFEQFTTDVQVVSSGFAFNAQVASEVSGDAVNSVTIINNTITNEDINDSAAISASKIDRTGLDADTLDGNDSTAFAMSTHAHANVDADTLDGNDSTAFAASAHGHNYAGSTSNGGPASDLSCAGCVSQSELNFTPGDITAVTAGTGLSGGGASGSVTINLAQQTRYLQLAGGDCSHFDWGTTPGLLLRHFLCDLTRSGNTIQAFWGVNLPNGATINGMRIHAYTAINTTTTCILRQGLDNTGTSVLTVTDAPTTGTNWTTTAEVTTVHVVDTSNYAYAVTCSNPDTAGVNIIGSIRIRYTY